MILALSTSTPQFGAALMTTQGTVLAEVASGAGHGNFRGLMPAVDFMIQACKIPVEEIEAVVVAKGPGSFTGLRVGLSAAKGMARGLGIPLVGVSSLAALAFRIPFSDHPVCAVLDSRKGELFYGIYNRPLDGPVALLREEDCIRESDLQKVIEEPAVFIGNDYLRQEPLIRGILGDRFIPAPPALWHPAASAVGGLGLERYLRGETHDLCDLVPVYFRPPDIRSGPVQRVSVTRRIK